MKSKIEGNFENENLRSKNKSYSMINVIDEISFLGSLDILDKFYLSKRNTSKFRISIGNRIVKKDNSSINIPYLIKKKERISLLLSKSDLSNETSIISTTDNESDLECDDEKQKDQNNSFLDDLFDKYYICSSQNNHENYDFYVSNCLKLISYFNKQKYFESIISSIKSNINNTHGNLIFDQQKPLLILDLDETLIHSDIDLNWSVHDHYLTIDNTTIAINIRPFLYPFLNFCKLHFEMVIFTASCSDYADPIIDFIEQNEKYFKYRFYREHCVFYKNLYIKDLSIFDVCLSRVIILDNNIFSFAHYLSNGILISSFYNDSDDYDLLSLIDFFQKEIIHTNDIREVIDSTFEFNMIKMSSRHST